jgi:hypothetical protein
MGRADKSPAEFWYQGEIGFLDFYVIPLARKLSTCDCFGVSSEEYLTYAQQNRKQWEILGQEAVASLVEQAEKNWNEAMFQSIPPAHVRHHSRHKSLDLTEIFAREEGQQEAKQSTKQHGSKTLSEAFNKSSNRSTLEMQLEEDASDKSTVRALVYQDDNDDDDNKSMVTSVVTELRDVKLVEIPVLSNTLFTGDGAGQGPGLSSEEEMLKNLSSKSKFFF